MKWNNKQRTRQTIMWNNIPDHPFLTILLRPKATNKEKKHMIFYPGFDWCCMEKHFSTEGMSIDGHQWEKSELVYTLQTSNIHAFCWEIVSPSVAFFKGWQITSTCLPKLINTTCNSLRICKLKKSMFNECLSVWLRHG